jgi:hypothetical protein
MESRTEARLRARAAAYQSWAVTEDRAARTAPGRAARDANFIKLVDPDGTLTDAELVKRVAAARRAYFSRLSLAAAHARRKRRES